MHDPLFHRQQALEDGDLRPLRRGRDRHRLVQFDRDRSEHAAMARIARDVASGEETGVVQGTPTLFIDGVLYEDDYDRATLLSALAPSLQD